MPSHATRKSRQSNSVFSKLIGSLFFGIFLLAGLAFTAFLGRELYKGLVTYTWDSAECEIQSSSVAETDDHDFTVKVSYSYTIKGKSYTSEQFERRVMSSGDRASVVHNYVDALPPGGTVTCYVDPNNPAEAVLKRSSLLVGLIILFPLIFVAVGAGGIIFVWKSSNSSSAGRSVVRRSRSNGRLSKIGPSALLGIFALVGGLGGYFFGIVPLQQYYDSASWSKSTCNVTSSEVRSHSSDDGTTYSIEIRYAYEFNNKPYHGDSYDFSSGSSSGYADKKLVVDNFPVGKEVPCYVNPASPSESVLVREIGNVWIPTLIFGIFFLVGAGGLLAMKRSGNSTRSSMLDATGSDRFGNVTFTAQESVQNRALGTKLGERQISSGPVTLKPSSTPLGRLFAVIFIALFWNGIVSVFLWQAYSSWKTGHPEYGLMLFLTPFVLVGVALIFGIIYTFLSLFNPRIEITLGSGAVPLGGSTSATWRLSGNTSRVKKLRVWLEGHEEATYRRGTDTRTDKKKFREIEIYSSVASGSFEGAQATIRIPENTMHSWESDNNKIVWILHARGEIDRWPDLNEEFAFVVLPMPVTKFSQRSK